MYLLYIFKNKLKVVWANLIAYKEKKNIDLHFFAVPKYRMNEACRVSAIHLQGKL